MDINAALAMFVPTDSRTVRESVLEIIVQRVCLYDVLCSNLVTLYSMACKNPGQEDINAKFAEGMSVLANIVEHPGRDRGILIDVAYD